MSSLRDGGAAAAGAWATCACLHQFKLAPPLVMQTNGEKWIADKGFGLPDAADGV